MMPLCARVCVCVCVSGVFAAVIMTPTRQFGTTAYFSTKMQPLNIAVTKSVLCAAGEQQQLGITAVVFYSLSFVPVAKVCE